MILLCLVLLPLIALTGCASIGDGGAAADGASVREASSEVVDELDEVDDEVAAAVGALRRADRVIARTHFDAMVLQSITDAAPARVELEGVDPDGVRSRLRELAAEVDEARASLADVRESEPEEAWVPPYLDAEDELLRAVREHAAAGDALMQLVGRHRGTYHDALVALEELLDDQNAENGADDGIARDLGADLDGALAGTLEPLALAREEINEFRGQREQTARQVDAARSDVADRYDQRSGS